MALILSPLTLGLGTAWLLLSAGPIILTPGLSRRRRIARFSARILLHLLGQRIHIKGLERLPRERCVLVANHASYLDGILLTAVLPPRFAFLIKQEMASVPLAGHILRRLGSMFVDREGGRINGVDTRRIFQDVSEQDALGVFPEGTFRRAPGLLAFRAGAFVTAVGSGLPVVPVTLQGSRQALPARSWLPAPARLSVHVHEALRPAGRSREARKQLQHQSRTVILQHLDEPDCAPPPA